MHVGGGLHYIDGAQGHGKSYYAVRRIRRALFKGQYVVTNVPLLPGWAERIARHDPVGVAFARGRREYVRRLHSLYVHTTTLGDVFRFDLPCLRCGAPRGEGGECERGHPLVEGRGLMVWDESHNDVGNRSWQEDGRETLLKGATQLRKLGYVAFLVTQHRDNTDAGLRRVAGWRVRMTNVRERLRLLGFRVLPRPYFVASYFRANAAVDTAEPEWYDRFLLRWDRGLYDTFGIYSGLYDDLAPLGARVVLPAPGAALPRRSRGEVVPEQETAGRWWEQIAGVAP